MEMSSFIHPAFAFIALGVIFPFIPSRWRRWTLLVPPLLAILSLYLVKPGEYGHATWLGVSLVMGRVDGLSLIFGQVFALVSLIGMIYAMHIEDKGQHIAACFYIAGGFGSVFAGDYLTLFAFWELMSIASTFLIFLNRTNASTHAAFRYFLYHTIGGLFLLGGMVVRFHATGSFAFDGVPWESAHWYDWMILIGFAVNAAIIPLHVWLPDAYPRATPAGAVFMCAFTTKTAVYVLARGYAGWEILIYAGAIMAVYAVGYALISNSVRRILAYDIVSQVGYMVVGVGVGTAMTMDGASQHAYAHILYKSLLFMSAGCLLQSLGTDQLSKLGGLAQRMPWLTFFFTVGAFSISGIPLFNGFVTKNITIAGTAEAHYLFSALALEVATVGTFIAVAIRLAWFVFWRDAPEDQEKLEIRPLAPNMYVAMSLGAFLCVLQGVFPSWFVASGAEYHYAPWAFWNVLQAGLLLGFGGLAALVTRKIWTRTSDNVPLDLDYFYRAIGRGILAFISKPIAIIDDFWSDVYHHIGINGLVRAADGSSVFDKKAIDGVVDGSARSVRGFGRVVAMVQSGNLQTYLGLAATIALILYGLVWTFG